MAIVSAAGGIAIVTTIRALGATGTTTTTIAVASAVGTAMMMTMMIVVVAPTAATAMIGIVAPTGIAPIATTGTIIAVVTPAGTMIGAASPTGIVAMAIAVAWSVVRIEARFAVRAARHKRRMGPQDREDRPAIADLIEMAVPPRVLQVVAAVQSHRL